MNAIEFFAAARSHKRHLTGLSFVARQVAFVRALIRQFANRRSDRLLYCDAASESFVQSCAPNAVSSAGSGQAWECFACHDDGAKASLVFRSLFKGRGPATVAGCIVSAGVEPVDRMFQRRTLAHVGEELDKRAIPFRANTDAARAVFGEILALWVRASALDAKPYPVSWAGLPAPRFVAVLKHVACIAESIPNARKLGAFA